MDLSVQLHCAVIHLVLNALYDLSRNEWTFACFFRSLLLGDLRRLLLIEQSFCVERLFFRFRFCLLSSLGGARDPVVLVVVEVVGFGRFYLQQVVFFFGVGHEVVELFPEHLLGCEADLLSFPHFPECCVSDLCWA